MSDHGCSSCGSGGQCGEHHGVSPEDKKLKDRLALIEHKIVVLSGKGGVGKSTVAVNIAQALALAGKRVGLMDVDVHGPSIPRQLGLSDAKPRTTQDHMEPVSYSPGLAVMSLGFLIPNADQSVIWRGPVKAGLIRQFIQDVYWGDLNYLVVDCPPGTGDEPLTVLQLIEDAHAVIVTTPQAVAIDDVRRSVGFCREMNIPVVGIVENMSGFVCSHCGEVEYPFGAGGGEQLAKDTSVPFLGAIPLDPAMRQAADDGVSFMENAHESPAAVAIGRVVKPLLALADSLQELVPAGVAASVDVAVSDATRIAVPVAAGQLCLHFGHCETFVIFDVDPATKEIKNSTALVPPAHEPGVFPAWLAEQGAQLILAGGMGSRAQSLFTDNGIRVVTGVPGGPAEDVVAAYLDGKLTAGSNICDH